MFGKMFNRKFENVQIKIVKDKRKGHRLKATNHMGEYILMDCCCKEPGQIPDGTNAYMFGNTAIFVTRWSDMSKQEKETVETAPLCLAIHPCKFVQFSLMVGRNWGDVFTTLHNMMNNLNDEEKPVTEAVFIFTDTQNPRYMISRSVKLPQYAQKFLQKCNVNDHKSSEFDSAFDLAKGFSRYDSSVDCWDAMYDLLWNETSNSSRLSKEYEPDDIPGGVYIEISSDNQVTKMYLNEK